MGRLLRWGGAVIGLVLVSALLAYGFLRGGAPRLDGEVALPGLSAPVQVARDALGVPSIGAANRMDAMRTLGFLHAQDRFFQMDVLRRVSAGELAALLGPSVLDIDAHTRLFRLRAVAKQVLEQATPAQRAAVQAYTDGVNAGLKALGTWPFEYGVLMRRPQRWVPEDSILVIDAMYLDLQRGGLDHNESDLALMRDVLPPALFRFLAAPGTQWDAPIVGKPVETPPFPGADVIDLRKQPSTLGDTVADAGIFDRHAAGMGQDYDLGSADIGSNNWAVSKEHGAGGRALVANDMHLGLRVPNTWYRAQWTYPDAALPGGRVTVTGITLPGVPAMVVGSNGHVAWGFTNSYGDWSDLVLLHIDPSDPDLYQTAEGWKRFVH
ncbi:MAG TPA: penicillin acylase family protein, partial [Gammaproteobacteria bacterium]